MNKWDKIIWFLVALGLVVGLVFIAIGWNDKPEYQEGWDDPNAIRLLNGDENEFVIDDCNIVTTDGAWAIDYNDIDTSIAIDYDWKPESIILSPESGNEIEIRRSGENKLSINSTEKQFWAMMYDVLPGDLATGEIVVDFNDLKGKKE